MACNLLGAQPLPEIMLIYWKFRNELQQNCGMRLESFSKVVVTFNYVGGSLNCFKYHHWGCLNEPIVQIWDYVLHNEHVSCVITNCGQHQWVICPPFSIVPALLEETLSEKYYPYIQTCCLEFCSSRLLSLYTFLSQSCLVTFSGRFVIVMWGSISVNDSVK